MRRGTCEVTRWIKSVYELMPVIEFLRTSSVIEFILYNAPPVCGHLCLCCYGVGVTSTCSFCADRESNRRPWRQQVRFHRNLTCCSAVWSKLHQAKLLKGKSCLEESSQNKIPPLSLSRSPLFSSRPFQSVATLDTT